ncbi:MAG TPA: Uma2 family endonuclease [Verrucomicrobiales bacterium]|nr:Uma2 family endonuclease [Verrucomicrobiales bacterium]
MELTVQLPPRQEQLARNRQRWTEVMADPSLARLPHRIETNRHGQVLISPPPSGRHSSLQGEIAFRLRQMLGGRTLPECPISTLDGVRAADVGWYSDSRYSGVAGQAVFELAPEICVEVLSPANTDAELAEKRSLYFEAGAEEVWFCREDGGLEFYRKGIPETDTGNSRIAEGFPQRLEDSKG